MSAQVVCEIYRTNENNGTFVSAVTITYFGTEASIQGLSGTFTLSCWRELTDYLKTVKNIKTVRYFRVKQDRVMEKIVSLG